MRTKQCEVVTSDCKCHRWEYNERLTNHPRQITTSASKTRPGCAFVVFTPGDKPSLTTIDLLFSLTSRYPTPPASFYYVFEKKYQLYLKTLPKNPVSFFQFVHRSMDLVCAASARAQPPPHVASTCDQRFLLSIVPVLLEEAKTPVTNHILPPVVIGTHLAGFLGLLLHLVRLSLVPSLRQLALNLRLTCA